MNRTLDVCLDDSGVIWCFTPERGVLRVGSSIETLCQSDLWRVAAVVRSVHRDRAFCWHISQRIGSGCGPSEQWISSTRVAWSAHQPLPQERLVCQYRMQMPTSVGGWRPVTTTDVLLWNLIQGECDTVWIEQHPVWPVVSFFNPTAHTAAVVLAGLVGDPRWTVNPDDPDSPLCLFSLLSLSRSRLKNVKERIKAWAGQRPDDSWTELGTEEARMRTFVSWVAPQNLLDPSVMEWFIIPHECRSACHELAVMRAYACLLRDCWLDAVRTSQRPTWRGGTLSISPLRLSKEEWLSPDRYFHGDALRRWRNHVKSWQA